LSAENTPPPLHQIDGAKLRSMLRGGMTLLRAHRDEVDSLNVFPVPDGDTGANMLLTMQSAWREVDHLDTPHAGALLRTFARGAIRGARGNSGVILSQILRGMAETTGDLEVLNAQTLAQAFRQAQITAYKGVMQPVEGTILTIIRAIADASEHAAALSDDLVFLLETSLSKAQETLARTPEMLPVLKEAGVVDAGGAGLVYLLEGIARVAAGETLDIEPEPTVISRTTPHLEALGDEWGYDIQFLVYNAPASEDEIRQKLIEMGGESIVVGRADNVTKVHVHNENPGPFLAYGASLGHMDDIVVENMTLQTLRRTGQWSEDGELKNAVSPDPQMPESQTFSTNIVAVAAGEGLQQVFRSLGACEVVAGGQSMNPSTEDLLQALERVPEQDVIILPNNKNIILAAKQAAALTDQKKAFVVETRTIPQGIAAMFAYNPELDAARNAELMQEMAESVHTIEITRAIRDARVNGVKVSKNEAIAIIDGDIRYTDENPEHVALQAVAALMADGDVITIYVGDPAEPDRARLLTETLRTRYPDMEVEVVPGGQPHYHYIISIE